MIVVKLVENEISEYELVVEQEVWACMFEYNKGKEGKKLYQKPILGKIMASCRKDMHDEYVEHIKKCGNYGKEQYGVEWFVPYKRNSKELAWSKAVRVYNRKYAPDEETSKQLYNRMIQDKINWHNNAIEELKKEMI